jgi:putative ABC transport system permease protein
MKRYSKLLRPFANAWGGVTSHKLRSLLTILGIVIGVSAVIALMSIGKGAEADILARIQTLGADLMMITPGSQMGAGGVRGAAGSAVTLTMEDAAAIEERTDLVASVSPIFSRSLQLIAGSQNMNAQVTGTTPSYVPTYNLTTTSGTFFSDYDYQRGSAVAVLGSTVAQTLYGTNEPLGQNLRLGTIIVRVIGVLASKGSVSGSPDNMVFVPLTAMQKAVAQQRTARGEQVISSISLKVKDVNNSDYIVQQFTDLMRTRHRLIASAANDFTITSMQEIASTVSETMNTTTMLLGAIAAISLLVGGIGVMNIMLVSVLERTREIGIRKALGAKDTDIWVQFLIESAFLSLAGGIIGVILGWGAAFLLSAFGTMHTLVSMDIVILAVSVSIAIGLFFGFYPAWQASRLNPIEALRYQ